MDKLIEVIQNIKDGSYGGYYSVATDSVFDEAKLLEDLEELLEEDNDRS